VGITQILGPDMGLFGWYMFIVGVLMLWMYKMTTAHIKEMHEILKDDSKIEAAFNARAGIDHVLDRQELAMVFKDLKIDLTHAELEMMLTILDPDHDGYISLPELKSALANHTETETHYYTIGPVPKLDPTKGDELKFKTKKQTDLHGHAKDAGGSATIDFSKVKKAI